MQTSHDVVVVVVCFFCIFVSLGSPILEQAGWPSAASSQLASFYSSQKDALRGTSGAASAASVAPPLSSLSSISFPSVIDVAWRVDDYLKSDVLDAVRAPSFLVELTVQGPVTSVAAASAAGSAAQQDNGLQRIPFTCNFQQMQDLLAKLKDAQKQIQQRVE